MKFLINIALAIICAVAVLTTSDSFSYAVQTQSTLTDAVQQTTVGEDRNSTAYTENNTTLAAEENTDSNITEADSTTDEQPISTVIGDGNGDGIVSAEDARSVLRVAVTLEEPTEIMLTLCDFDSDNTITSADARGTLRVAVGLPAQEIIKKTDLTEEEYVRSFIDMVEEENIQNNISYLCDTIGARPVESAALISTKSFLLDTLESYGYEGPELYTQNVEKYTDAQNVIAVIGTAIPNPDIVVFSAHYDSARLGNGAVDNGSGVSTVLELARIMKECDTDFGFEIRFCFFTAEEMICIGAYKYTEMLTDDEYSRHVLAMNNDMTAKPSYDKDYYLAICTEPVAPSYGYPKLSAKQNLGSISLDCAKEIVGSCTEKAYYSPITAGLHDTLPFRKIGIPACSVSWREFSRAAIGKQDYGLIAPIMIHTDNDTLANMSMQSLYDTTRLVIGAAAEICFTYNKRIGV